MRKNCKTAFLKLLRSNVCNPFYVIISCSKVLLPSFVDNCKHSSTGRIHFTLDYSFSDNSLTVGIVEAQDIPAKDFSGTSDPYARVMLLPDRKKKFDTKASITCNCQNLRTKILIQFVTLENLSILHLALSSPLSE